MSLQYSVVGSEDGSMITVIVSGRQPLAAHSSHPQFNAIVQGAMAGDESVIDLFDVATAAKIKFERLTERVTVSHGRIYFDGEELNNGLGNQIIRFMEAGEDFKPLVRFLDNVMQNPNEHSRTQLYDWLNAEDFTITENGMIVGYKGVEKIGDGTYQSTRGGKALVNGEVFNGKIPQKVGDIVEMPRGDVAHNPAASCSTGLHVATHGFAQGFNKGAILELHVNPRDVVSVPTDGGGAKVRVCRYTVVGESDAPYSAPLVTPDYAWTDDFDWGDDCDCDVIGCDCDDCDCVTEAVEQKNDSVQVGDRFKDRDVRRAYSDDVFVVDRIGNGYVVGKWQKSNQTRTIKIDRLLSYKYERVN